MRLMSFLVLSAQFVCGGALLGVGQSTAPVATSTLQASLLELTGQGAVLQDLTMQGTAEYQAGSTDETGPVTLKANSSGNTRVTLSLPSGVRDEIHTFSNGTAYGASKDKDGLHVVNYKDLVVEPFWFVPELLLKQLSDPAHWVASSSASANTQKSGIDTISLVRNSNPEFRDFVARYGGMQMTFQGTSLQGLHFQVYGNRPNVTPVEMQIAYSNYQPACGHLVPMNIVRYVNGIRQLSISIATVQCNTGLQQTDFSF